MKKMNKKQILKKLEKLFYSEEVKKGFFSKESCMDWSNKVAPLLRFNQQYYYNFLRNAHNVSLPVSSYTIKPALNVMKNQVQMAIEELKLDVEQEVTVEINPIERNAKHILATLNRKDRISNNDLLNKTKLNQQDLKDAVEYLEGLGALDVIRELGNPYFLSVTLQSRGKYLYHELKSEEEKFSQVDSQTFSLPLQPLNPVGCFRNAI